MPVKEIGRCKMSPVGENSFFDVHPSDSLVLSAMAESV